MYKTISLINFAQKKCVLYTRQYGVYCETNERPVLPRWVISMFKIQLHLRVPSARYFKIELRESETFVSCGQSNRATGQGSLSCVNSCPCFVMFYSCILFEDCNRINFVFIVGHNYVDYDVSACIFL